MHIFSMQRNCLGYLEILAKKQWSALTERSSLTSFMGHSGTPASQFTSQQEKIWV